MLSIDRCTASFYGFAQNYSSILALMHAMHERVAHCGAPNHIMLLEHEPVITYGRLHETRSFKTSIDAIREDKIAVHMADRGGDATFHGPGQLVVYPIVKINNIEKYICDLEAAVLIALESFGLQNLCTLKGFRGIWLKSLGEKKNISLKKLVAIGVGIKDGVSKHGFALNININYEAYTKHIIPCGLKDRGVATLTEAFSLESLEMPDYWVIVQRLVDTLTGRRGLIYG